MLDHRDGMCGMRCTSVRLETLRIGGCVVFGREIEQGKNRESNTFGGRVAECFGDLAVSKLYSCPTNLRSILPQKALGSMDSLVLSLLGGEARYAARKDQSQPDFAFEYTQRRQRTGYLHQLVLQASEAEEVAAVVLSKREDRVQATDARFLSPRERVSHAIHLQTSSVAANMYRKIRSHLPMLEFGLRVLVLVRADPPWRLEQIYKQFMK